MKTVTIDRKEQSIADPDNTNDYCVLLYKCECGNDVYDTDNYCSKCGAKLKFINEPILDEKYHYIPPKRK